MLTAANTALTYVIADGDADNKFTVNATTGLISTTSRLDRESRHSWIVTGSIVVYLWAADARRLSAYMSLRALATTTICSLK